MKHIKLFENFIKPTLSQINQRNFKDFIEASQKDKQREKSLRKAGYTVMSKNEIEKFKNQLEADLEKLKSKI